MGWRARLAAVMGVVVVGLASAGSASGEPDEPDEGRPWFPDQSSQRQSEPSPPHEWVTRTADPKPRGGFFISAGFGGGILSGVDDETAAASAMDIRFGLLLTPRLGIAADIFAAARTRTFLGEAVYMFSSIGPSVTYWLSPRLWAVAGVDAAGLFRRPTPETPASESGGAGVHALVGFECLRTKSGNGVLNLQVRLFGGVPGGDDDIAGVLLLLGGAGFGLESDD